jgi:hypothetical protein
MTDEAMTITNSAFRLSRHLKTPCVARINGSFLANSTWRAEFWMGIWFG